MFSNRSIRVVHIGVIEAADGSPGFRFNRTDRSIIMINTMLKSILTAAAVLSATMAVPALAHGDDHDRYRGSRHSAGHYYYGDRGYRDYRHDNRYYGRSRYYRGDRCDKGTGGTIIGAIAGGLAGNEIAGRNGDRTMGTIIGAGVGAVAGRAIDRSDRRC